MKKRKLKLNFAPTPNEDERYETMTAYEQLHTEYQPRFVSKLGLVELFNLFHLARTALVGEDDQGINARMRWASHEYSKSHPEATRIGAYKDLSAAWEFARGNINVNVSVTGSYDIGIWKSTRVK